MNSEVNKVLFIVNKYAGTGYQPELEGKILDACEKQENVACTIEFTRSRGHATTLAREAIGKGFVKVIAVGGDGTVNEVAQGLIHSAVNMGIIPRGSGNGLARHLGIPIKINDALVSLFKSSAIDMDTMMINNQLSLNVSGIGFDGHIANLFGTDSKRGLAGYVKLTVKEFITFKELDATLTVDGKNLDRKAFIIAIANSSQYGNNARIAPTASVCDQLLNITLLKKVPVYRADFVLDFFTGKLGNSRYCEVLEAKHVTIKLNVPVAYHIDGEPSGIADTFDIKVIPASLKMLAPVIAGKH